MVCSLPKFFDPMLSSGACRTMTSKHKLVLALQGVGSEGDDVFKGPVPSREGGAAWGPHHVGGGAFSLLRSRPRLHSFDTQSTTISYLRIITLNCNDFDQ